jgi:hypothetical protein
LVLRIAGGTAERLAATVPALLLNQYCGLTTEYAENTEK